MVATIREQLDYLEKKRRSLVVVAPHDGRIVSLDPAILVGAFVREGQPVCEVVDETSVRVTATLDQAEASWIYDLRPGEYKVEYRLASLVPQSFSGVADAPMPAGLKELPHPGLGYQGGGTIETEAGDNSGLVPSRPIFKLYVYGQGADGQRLSQLTALAAGSGAGRPGERAYLRFTLPSKPLAVQWADRLQKLILGRAKI
jgi:hypothetical protein